MPDFFHQRGSARARAILGVAKLASDPEMGDALYTTISSATGDDSLSRSRTSENPTDQTSTSMDEHDRHMVRDPHNDAHVFPAAAQQSLGLKRAAALSYDQIEQGSPVPVLPHTLAKQVGGGAFLNRDHGDIKAPSIVVDPDAPDQNILAHEIGHAQFQDSALGKFTQHPVARGAQLAAPLASYAAGRYLPSSKLKALGIGAASLGLSAPTLISEGAADYKGYQYLKGLGASEEELEAYVKKLMLLQSTYAMLPLASAGLGAVGARGANLGKLAAAHKLHGRRKFRNLNISIENRKGSTRSWYDPHEDRHGSTVQRYPYGYIRMTEGMDGDHIDCYVGPHENAKNVYVITTSKPPSFKEVDEQKCMLGFNSATAARKAFAQHYDKPGFFRSMKALPYEEFEKKVLGTLHGKQKKVASNRYQSDDDRLIDNSPGTFNDQVPGDYLGLPSSSLVGMRSIKGGNPEDPSDTIERMFRFHDNPMSSRVLEGNSSVLPESPGV